MFWIGLGIGFAGFFIGLGLERQEVLTKFVRIIVEVLLEDPRKE